MTRMRFALLLLSAMAIEQAVFRYVYRDLLYFQQPATQLAEGPRERLREYASKALARRTLNRSHLETLVLAAWQAEDTELHSRALARLAQDYPDDQDVQLRWAESLRLAGRLDEATAIYHRLVGWDARRSAGR